MPMASDGSVGWCDRRAPGGRETFGDLKGFSLKEMILRHMGPIHKPCGLRSPSMSPSSGGPSEGAIPPTRSFHWNDFT